MANLSQIKRKHMLDFLDELKKENNDDDKTLIAINEIENALNEKKYGLVWERHEEAVDVKMKTHIPVFVEDKEREITAAPGEPYNFLLEGDNLHSLRLLEKTHKGKIDVIYIDPPYNTGNRDFVYDDALIDNEDGFRHSKWLSFIYERLISAKDLLSEKGKIFISIDDNEISNLRLLCNEIFGEDNFISQITLLCNPKGRSQDKYFATCHEYLLVYAKNESNLSKDAFQVEKSADKVAKDYKQKDERGFFRYLELRNTHREFGRKNRPNLWYPIFINPSSNLTSKVSLTKNDNFSEPVFPYWKDGYEGCWTWGKELASKDISLLVGRKSAGKWKIYRKSYARDATGQVAKQKLFTIWQDPSYYTEKGQAEFGKIFIGSSKNDFPQPKSVEYIKNIIRSGSNKDSIILDFFAGSGTTAQAVIELNREDSGHRKFILCTNNENNICQEITYPRVKTVITGVRPDGSKYSDGIPANLKYYHTDFVAKNEEFLSDALLEHIAEMIQLEHGIKLDGKQYLMIMSDEEADRLAAHWSEYPDVKALYVSKNVLFTTKQKQLFKDVEKYIIPDYYFDFELQEAGESW